MNKLLKKDDKIIEFCFSQQCRDVTLYSQEKKLGLFTPKYQIIIKDDCIISTSDQLEDKKVKLEGTVDDSIMVGRKDGQYDFMVVIDGSNYHGNVFKYKKG